MGATTARRVRVERAQRWTPPRSPYRRRARRVLGVLATLSLLGVAVASASMVGLLRGHDAGSAVAAGPDTADAASTPARVHHHAKRRPAGPTRAQRRARAGAVKYARDLGYVPVRLKDWSPKALLRVLVVRRSATPAGPERVLFFASGRFLGFDSSMPSTRLSVRPAGRRAVRVLYRTYRPADAACCPGGRASVTFRWTGTALAPAGAIPPSWLRLRG